jgi:cell division initiation protein
MKITPVDISHKVFAKKLYGLDETQVTEYLAQVAQALEEVTRDRNSLRDALREKDLALVDLRERDRGLKETINAAAQMSDKMRIDGEREVKLIIADAQQKADTITPGC